MKLIKYVRFWFPGSFVSDDTIRESVSDTRIDFPDGAYAAQRFSRFETEDPRGGKMVGPEYDHGSKYIEGEAYTLEQVKALPGDYHILIRNMEGNDWPRVVRCRQGFLPLSDKDVVIPVPEVSP